MQPFINLLNNLEISCVFSNKGCKKYLKLGELEYHVDSCNFNPNLNIFCDCGLKLETINSTDHKNNCIHHLKKQLNGSLDIIKSLYIRNNQLENDLKEAKKETTISNEWYKSEGFEEIATNMPKIMKDRITNLLRNSLDEGIFNSSNLGKKLGSSSSGNWTVIAANGLQCNHFYRKNYLSLKIGKVDVLIASTVKPVLDFLILEKLIKSLDEGINNKCWIEDIENVWHLFSSLINDSLNISERLLEKNIVEYFLQFYALFPKRLFRSMFEVFSNISEFPELRNQLMKPEFLIIFSKQLSNNRELSFLCSYFFANILSEGKKFWDQNLRKNCELNRNSIIAKLKSNICDLGQHF